MFAGSGTIHLNTNVDNIVVNDINHIVISLQEFISNSAPNKLYNELKTLANEYFLHSEKSEGYIK